MVVEAPGRRLSKMATYRLCITTQSEPATSVHLQNAHKDVAEYLATIPDRDIMSFSLVVG